METQANQADRFEQWCIVEVMGHNVYAGFVTERTLGGTAMIQVDVPQVDDEHPAFTKLLSANAIYAITPTSEAHAREAAARIRQRPVTIYILPDPKPQLMARVADPEPDLVDGELLDDHWNDDDDDDDEIGF